MKHSLQRKTNRLHAMVLLFLLTALSGAGAYAQQLTGAITVPSTLYPSIAIAVDSLNLYGVGSGGVIINVAAGTLETAPVGGYKLNATGTASNPIIIQKDPSTTGSNPLITSAVGTSTTNDGVFFLLGSDYVTINGIDIVESAGNTTALTQMEWGYALLNKSNVAPFNGCNNNTIKNCSISLDRTNANSRGIYLNHHIATNTTALTLTAVADAHSNNSFHANKIQNVWTGIFMSGYADANFTLRDMNNDVGGSSYATADTITALGIGSSSGFAAAANGVYMANQMNPNVSYNYIDNAMGGVPATLTFMGVYATSTGQNINNHFTLKYNTLYLTHGAGAVGTYCANINNYDGNVNISNNDIKIISAGQSTSNQWGLYFSNGSTAIGSATFTFKNNTAQNWTLNNTIGQITIFTVGTPNQANQDISGNIINNITRTSGTTGSIYGIYGGNSSLGLAIPGSVTNVYNNSITNITLNFSSTSIFYGIQSVGNNTANYYNNTISGITAPTGLVTIYGFLFNGGADVNFYDNTISGFSATRDAYGFWGTQTSKTFNVYNNKIYDLTCSGGASNTATGIYFVNIGQIATNIYNNRIYKLTETAAGASTAQGINITNGGAAITTTSVPLYIYNNIIGDLRAPLSIATATPCVIGMNITATTNPLNAYVRYNNVYLNDTASANSNSAAIYQNYTGSKLYLNNNLLVNNTYHAAGTGNACGIVRNGTVLTNYDVTSGNNLIYAGTPSMRNLIFFDGVNKDSVWLTFKSRVYPREMTSVSNNITMFNASSVPPVAPGAPHYLQNDTTVASLAESGALNIAGITTDIRGVIRQGNPGYAGTGSKPDIGAFESAGPGVNMVFDDLIVAKNNTNALIGSVDQPVVNIQVYATGNSNTLSATQFTLSTSGSTNAADIAKAKVYYTGSSSAFSTATSFGSVVVSPSGAFTITGSQPLVNGLNNFWLAYDVSPTATVGNILDAVVTNVIAGITKIPSNGNPPGSKTISAPLSGIITVGVAPYLTLASVVSVLNSNGISAPVTVNIPAGFTETAPAGGYVLGSPVLNASLSANRGVVFQKNGAGTNPLLTAQVGTSTGLDGIFTLAGTDYVTIDAIDLVDTNTVSATTQMEWGYGLVKATTATALYDGCQNVVIKNSTITLRITYGASVGIYANNHLVNDGTLLTLSNVSETNSYNTLIGNTIQSVNTGISFRGYGLTTTNTTPDVNNIIGDLNAGNIINNFGGTLAGFGINVFNNANASIRYNIVDNAAGLGGAPTVAAQVGIQHSYTFTGGVNAGGVTVSNNDVTITVAQGFAGATTDIGVHNTHGKVNINNNNVKWVTAGTGVLANASFTGIGYNLTGGGSYMADVLNFNGNTVKDFTFTTSGSITFKAFSVLGSAMVENISYDSIYNITRIAGLTPAGTITLFDNFTTNNPSATMNPGAVRNIHHNYIVGYNNGGVTAGSLTALNVGNGYNVNVYNNRISSIVNGNVGNTVYGINAGSGMMNVKIYNNVIDTLTGGTGSTYGIGLSNAYGISTDINNNTISNLSATGSTASLAIGINITSCGRNAKVYNNRVYNVETNATGAAYASGILMVNMSGVAQLNQAPFKVYNNLISGIAAPTGTSNPSVTGIVIAYATSTSQPFAQLYNNTILLSGTTGSNMHSAGIYTMNTSTGNFKLANNIVMNNITPSGTGNAVALYRGAATLTAFDQTSNNNIYWAGTPSANNLIYFDGTNKDQTIAAYKTRVYPRESASETQNVTMISTTGTDAYYLYPDTTLASSVANSGLPIAGMTTDYNNTIRSATTPDIGAYEGNFTFGDITAPAITISSPLTNTAASIATATLTATIKDAVGVANVVSGSGPRVYFKKTGGSYTSEVGALVSGTTNNGVWSFTINSAAITGWAVGDTISYYVVAQDINNTLGSGPAGVSGSGVSSISIDPTPYKFVITNGLAGTYTVCTSGCDFTSLSNTYGAFDSINKSALAGNVTLSINGDLLNESGSVGINSIAQPGNYSVMIVPGSASEKLIVGNVGSNAGIVNFNGGDNVTIDGRFAGSGKYLRFRNRNTGGSTIRWYNDAQRDTVRYVYLEGITSSVATAYFSTPATGGTGNDFNALMYCEIRDTLGNGNDPLIAAMNVPNSAVYSDGHLNSDNTIAYNNCYNFIYNGINIASARELSDNWTIHQNAFYQQPAVQAKAGNASSGAQQIIFIQSGQGHTISNNSIGGSAPDRSGLASKALYISNFSIGYSGIVLATYLGIDQTTTISGNTIANIDANPTQITNQFCGILVQSGRVNITNNTVGGATLPHDTIKEGSYSTGNAGGIVLAGGIVNVSDNTVGNISNYISSNQTTTLLRTVGISIPGGAINSPYEFSVVNNTIRDIKSNFYYGTATNYLNAQGGSPVGIFTVANLGIPINIEGNTIYNITNTNNSGVSAQANGITLRGGSCTVQRNRIYNINTSGAGTGSTACGIYGIEVVNNSTFGNVIKNNQISLTPSSTADANVFGIMDGNTVSTRDVIANNSVYIGGSSTGTSYSYAVLTGASNSISKVDITNNILYNARTGATATHFAAGAYFVPSAINANSFGYNLMITPSASAIIESPSGTSMNTSAVQAMYTTKSSNTNWIETVANVPASGLFANTANGTLGLNATNAASWYANGKGLPMSSVTNDFNNVSRSTTIVSGASDIGSVEVTPTVAPASAVASAAPALNTTTNYTYGSNVVASVTWGAAGTVPSSLDVKYYSGTNVPSPVPGRANYNAYYSVTPTGGTGYTYNIALAYDSAVMGTVESVAASRMAYFKSPTWTWLASSSANMTSGLLSSGGSLAATTLPASFTGTSFNNPLPVTLVNFTGVAVQGDVQLGWTTANEVNNLGFEVERSVDGRSFKAVGFVSGAGNSSKQLNYELTDNNAFKVTGSNGLYYRLKQIDLDGRSLYSDVVYVTELNKETIEMNLYPNPATDVFNVSAMVTKPGTMEIAIMDIQGKVLVTERRETVKGINTVSMDPSELNGVGIYFVKVTVGGETKVMKLMKH